MHNTPFFSVCIPATDRANTIKKTLESVANQTFKNYEVIITARECTDNTKAIVYEFFQSEYYTSNPFDFRFIEVEKEIDGADDWNDPLLHAKGLYIAMLEGDDKFARDRLQIAFDYLSNNEGCGILASGNQEKSRSLKGRVTGAQYARYIYKLKEVPPPSETIFKRLSISNEPYLYNSSEYLYAPEIDLYIRIANDGYYAYHDGSQTIIRDRSTSFLKGVGWKYFRDHFLILKKYKANNNYTTFLLTRMRLEFRMLKAFIKEASEKTELFRHLAVVKLIMPTLAKRKPVQEKCAACGGRLFLYYDAQKDINFRMTTDEFFWSKCENCNSIRIGPSEKLDNLTKYYKNYKPHRSPLRYYSKGERPYALIRKRILEKFGPTEKIRIIDLGCGAGVTLYNLRKDFENSVLFGVDLNIENASRHLLESDVTLCAGMLGAVTLKTKFDVIISSQFLEHLADPNEYKKFIENYANDKALIFLDVPNIDSVSSRLFGENWIHLDTPRHQWLPTKKGLRQLFNNCQNIEFYAFGSYMAYVSSIKLVMKVDIYPDSVLNKILTRMLQALFFLIPKDWEDDKLLMVASLKDGDRSSAGDAI